jgi:serine phosphatase RsbU (regulator of sigma subunit)/anti-anti-sigma regulatory factor
VVGSEREAPTGRPADAAGAGDYVDPPMSKETVGQLVHVPQQRESGDAADPQVSARRRERLIAAVSTEIDREMTLQAQRAALVRSLVAEDLVDGARLSSIDDTGQLVTRAFAARSEENLRLIRSMRPSGRGLETPVSGPRLVRVDERYLSTYLADPEQRELRRRLNMRTAAIIPLMARGRITGYVSAARTGPSRPLDEADFELLVDICQRAAISLDNALLLERERVTRRRLELLQRATAGLSAAATPTQIADTAVAEFDRLLATDAVSVYELRGSSLDALHMGTWSERARRDWETMPLDSPAPGPTAARGGKPVWLESRDDWQRDYPDFESLLVDEYGFPSTGYLPLLAGGRCLGMIALGFRAERRLSASDRAAASALADLCAQALLRAGLLAAESQARREAEEFSKVVGALSVAITPADVAEVILEHAAGLGATEAVVVLCEGDQLTPLAARSSGVIGRLRVDDAHPLAHAARSGQPVWLANRSRLVWADDGFAPDRQRPVQMAVPLAVGRTMVGAVGLHFGAAPPALSPAERAAILTVASQCAQALERARLHQAEHEVAEVLQRSLLPRRLPELPRLAVATSYLPAAQGTQAGGDWYELLPAGPSRVAIVVGDVVGHGAAAAAVMGQLRSALASSLLDGNSPAQALEKLDRFARRVDGALATTCACLVLDYSTGELSYASAGHLPILLLEPGGPRFLDQARGTVLGLRNRDPYAEASTAIEPGTTVLAYTDGLIERRDESLSASLSRLAATAGPLALLPPDRLIDALADLGPIGRARPDDVTVIAVRLLPDPARERPTAAHHTPRTSAAPSDPGGNVVAPPAVDTLIRRTWSVEGDLTGDELKIARAELLALVRDADEVVIDLCSAGFLGSAALGLFTEALNEADERGVRLSMRIPRRSLAARAITVTDLDTALEIEWVT